MRTGLGLPVKVLIAGTLLVIFAMLIVALSPMIGSNVREGEEELQKCINAGGYCVERSQCFGNDGRIMTYASCEDQSTGQLASSQFTMEERQEGLVCCSQPAK